jgi:hypothetical protein
MTTEIKLYLGAAAAAILAIAIGWFVIHERDAGEHKIEKQDSAALVVAKSKADEGTKANEAKATLADLGAEHDQQVIDAYRAAHPEQPVRLCHASNSIAGVSAASAADGKAQGPGSGSAPVREVQGGTVGPDIGPGLDALVQAAGRLAVIDAEWQHR